LAGHGHSAGDPQICRRAGRPSGGRTARDPEAIALLPLAFGPVSRKLGEGATPEELGLDRLREAIDGRIGAHEATLWWSYRVRCAVK